MTVLLGFDPHELKYFTYFTESSKKEAMVLLCFWPILFPGLSTFSRAHHRWNE